MGVMGEDWVLWLFRSLLGVSNEILRVVPVRLMTVEGAELGGPGTPGMISSSAAVGNRMHAVYPELIYWSVQLE